MLAQHVLHLVAAMVPVHRQSRLRVRLGKEGVSKAACVLLAWAGLAQHARTHAHDLCTQTGNTEVSALRVLVS